MKETPGPSALPAAASPPPSSPERPSPRSLLHRDFLLLWQAQAISQLGNQAFAVACAYWAMETAGSASLIGLMMMAVALPRALLAPLGGTLADRLPRVPLIAGCDLLNGLVLAAVAGILAAGGAPTPLLLGSLIAAAALSGSLTACVTPAVGASLPDLVPPQRLSAANSLNQLTVRLAMLAGQGIGGVLYRWFGAPLLLLLDGLSFLFAAASESFVRLPAPGATPLAPRTAQRESFASQLRGGLTHVWGKAGLRNFLLAASAFNLFATPLLVLLPFYVRDVLRRQADWYGFLLAAISGGTVLGFVVAGTLPLPAARRGRVMLAVMLAASLCLLALALFESPPAALAAAAVLGTLLGWINVSLVTALQRTTPGELRGRVMGLASALSGALSPLGMALGGLAGDLTGKDVPLVAAVCAAASSLLTLVLVGRRATQDFLAYR